MALKGHFVGKQSPLNLFNHNNHHPCLIVYNIPAPDYETDSTVTEVSTKSNVVMEKNGDIYEAEESHGSLSPEQIRSMMSKEQKDLQRDLKIMQKRLGALLQLGYFIT